MSLWDDKDKTSSWRVGPKTQVVEKSVGIDDLKEASRHITITSREQCCPFCWPELSLEVFDVRVCRSTQSINAHLNHHPYFKKLSTG
jgi:hypothetical protein